MGNIRKQSNESFRTKQTYIRNADPFLTAAQLGYSTYADAAGTSPVDGTGGSPNITFSVNTTTPISNDADFRFVKDANNRQGEGVKYDYTIDNIHLARVLQGSIECQLISGTYATGDLRFYLIETTSGAVIEPVNVELQLGAVGITVKHIFTFQTNITNTTYRLCVHVASTSASAYTVAFNNFRVWEPEQNYGAFISDPQPYPSASIASFQGLGTITELNLMYSRRGAYLDVDGDWTNGTTSSSELRIPLPPGLTSDSDLSESGFPAYCGEYNRDSASEQLVVMCENSKTYFTVGSRDPSVNIFAKINGDTISQSNLKIRIKASVRIAGWGSNMALSSDAGDGRMVASRYYATSSSFTSPNIINFDTMSIDTHNTVTVGGSWKFTAPVSGIYRVSSGVYFTGSSGSFCSVAIRKNGTNYARQTSYGGNTANQNAYISDIVSLNAGEYIDIYGVTNLSGLSLDAGEDTFVSVELISTGSQIIAPVETVACAYYSSTTQTSLTGQINFGVKLHDTHNAVTTGSSWKFTAPMAGKYSIKALLCMSGGGIFIRLYKNGVQFNFFATYLDSASGTGTVSIDMDLLTGDYIDLRPASSADIQGGTLSSSNASQIYINRIGI